MELIWAHGLQQEARDRLLVHSPSEYGGALLCRTRPEGHADVFLALALEPATAEEISESEETGLTIDPAFWVRLAKPARKQGLSIIPIHTHPLTHGAPGFSGRDRAGERRLQPVLERLTGRPSGAVVMGREHETVGRYEGGKRVEGIARSIGQSPERQAAGPLDTEVFSRHIRAFGEEGQQRLQSLRVGVVGASGTGSHVCEQLVRLGVGEVVVVDPDVVSRVNLNRVVTSSGNDAARERAKVDTVVDYAAWAATGCKVEGVRGDVLDYAVNDRLRTLDALFGCTDTIASRAILNRIAVQHFIPYWDCGTEISAGRGLRAYGRMRVVLAGGPCLYCYGVIDPEALRVELLDPTQRELERARGYIRGVQDAAPAVVSINGVVASLAVTSFLRWAVGDAPIEGGEWIFRSYAGDVRRQQVQRDPQCPVCSPGARLGRTDLPVGFVQ